MQVGVCRTCETSPDPGVGSSNGPMHNFRSFSHERGPCLPKSAFPKCQSACDSFEQPLSCCTLCAAVIEMPWAENSCTKPIPVQFDFEAAGATKSVKTGAGSMLALKAGKTRCLAGLHGQMLLSEMSCCAPTWTNTACSLLGFDAEQQVCETTKLWYLQKATQKMPPQATVSLAHLICTSSVGTGPILHKPAADPSDCYSSNNLSRLQCEPCGAEARFDPYPWPLSRELMS